MVAAWDVETRSLAKRRLASRCTQIPNQPNGSDGARFPFVRRSDSAGHRSQVHRVRIEFFLCRARRTIWHAVGCRVPTFWVHLF